MDKDIKRAPIVIFAYKRVGHLQKVLEALEKNQEAQESELFIFVDGWKNEEEKRAVKEVHNFLDQYVLEKRFKNIFMHTEERNKGLANSVISGVTKVLDQYEKVIVIEDDICVSPGFLSYMNEALNYYENESEIWSVTGYTPPLKCLKKYKKDVYATCRFCSWSWGIWKDRWEKVDWTVSDYKGFLESEEKQKMFARAGADLPGMLKSQMNGKIDSWAIRCSYGQFCNKAYTIAPRVSLIKNIGHDGTGTHCGANTKYESKVAENEKRIKLEQLPLSKRIDKETYNFWSGKGTLLQEIKKKLLEKKRCYKETN